MWGRKAGDQPISQSAAEENYVGLIRCDENSQPFPLASVSQSVTNLCIVSLVPKANGLEKAKPSPLLLLLTFHINAPCIVLPKDQEKGNPHQQARQSNAVKSAPRPSVDGDGGATRRNRSSTVTR
jgi:hypothetical protein